MAKLSSEAISQSSELSAGLIDTTPKYDGAIDIDGNSTVDAWETDAYEAGLTDDSTLGSFTAWFGGEDGKLSEDEYNAGLKTADLNADGKLSSNELFTVNLFASSDVKDRDADKANFVLSEAETTQLNTFYTANKDAVDAGNGSGQFAGDMIIIENRYY